MFTIVDIETTGGSPVSERITEIAIYVFDGEQVIDEFVTLINPERSIPPFITQMTGISNQMVANAPKFYEVAKRIIEITENRVFVAHNVDFDYNFIKNEFKNLGYDFRRKKLCTVKLSRKLLPGHKSYSLGNICTDLGISNTSRHRAAGDAFATVQLFNYLLQRDTDGKPVVKAMAGYLPTGVKYNFDEKILDDLPESTGVYYFYNEKNDLIYIGKSNNIRARVLSHLSNNKTKRGIEMRNAIFSIDYELTGSELVAFLQESEQIKQNTPLYNRAQRRTMEFWGIYFFIDINGYINLTLNRNSDENGIPLISFSTKAKAEEVLYGFIADFNLCQKLCGLYKTAGACFNYSVKQCNGACCGTENSDSYNSRATKLIEKFTYSQQSFFLIDKGRDMNEKAVIQVKNGKYLGFGYIISEEANRGTETLADCIKRKKDNSDIQKIIRSYMRRQKGLIVIAG